MAFDTLLAATDRGVVRLARPLETAEAPTLVLPGVDCRCLAADPRGSGAVFAGTHGMGLLRSTDGGTTWRPSGLDGQIVKAVAISPAEPGLVVAGTKPPNVHLSRDGGETWNEAPTFRRIPFRWLWGSPAEPPWYQAYVQAIALSPTDPDIMVVGIEAGATVRTIDGGRTWSRHLQGALRDCHSLAVHPADGRVVCEAGGTGAGASRSDDGGATWRQPHPRLEPHYGWATAVDPADPAIWYVSVAPGPKAAHGGGFAAAALLRNDGDRWVRLAGGLPTPLPAMPYALLTARDRPGTLLAVMSDATLWLGEAHGERWTCLAATIPGFRRVATVA